MRSQSIRQPRRFLTRACVAGLFGAAPAIADSGTQHLSVTEASLGFGDGVVLGGNEPARGAAAFSVSVAHQFRGTDYAFTLDDLVLARVTGRDDLRREAGMLSFGVKWTFLHRDGCRPWFTPLAFDLRAAPGLAITALHPANRLYFFGSSELEHVGVGASVEADWLPLHGQGSRIGLGVTWNVAYFDDSVARYTLNVGARAVLAL